MPKRLERVTGKTLVWFGPARRPRLRRHRDRPTSGRNQRENGEGWISADGSLVLGRSRRRTSSVVFVTLISSAAALQLASGSTGTFSIVEPISFNETMMNVLQTPRAEVRVRWAQFNLQSEQAVEACS